RELGVADGVALAARSVVGLRFAPECKRRAREYSAERELDTAFEPGHFAPVFEERHQPVDIGGLERAPIRTPRKRSEDLARAARLVVGTRRPAREDAAAARRDAGARGIERAGDRQRLDMRPTGCVVRAD